tara:strand:- start:31 stop:225 length:195 start_codon:yes stop_codon:yes gene_type:complete
MKVGDLIKNYDGVIGIVLTTPRLSYDCHPDTDDSIDQYDVVDILMPWGREQYATDELEIVSESR